MTGGLVNSGVSSGDVTTVEDEIAEHDFVELLDGIGRWDAGVKGTVVSDYGDAKLVEIADERGVSLDFVQVPESGLKLISKYR